MELNPLPDAEIQHRAVRAHLMEESESSHNLVIQLDKFFFGKRINIDVAHGACRSPAAHILHRKRFQSQPVLPFKDQRIQQGLHFFAAHASRALFRFPVAASAPTLPRRDRAPDDSHLSRQDCRFPETAAVFPGAPLPQYP
jgi:hypothetical protein